MNERLKELAVQAGLPKYMTRELCPTVIERFADLVLQNYISQIMTTEEREQFIRQDEREAIAALVEADGRVHPKAPDAVWAKTVAKLIRARGNHD